MRRSLVISDERARHPFLRQLPPHVRGGQKVPCREAEAEPEAPAAQPSWAARQAYAARGRFAGNLARAWKSAKSAPKAISASDVRHFLLAYCACFVAVSAFIY
jgi:hypothetical protein